MYSYRGKLRAILLTLHFNYLNFVQTFTSKGGSSGKYIQRVAKKCFITNHVVIFKRDTSMCTLIRHVELLKVGFKYGDANIKFVIIRTDKLQKL